MQFNANRTRMWLELWQDRKKHGKTNPSPLYLDNKFALVKELIIIKYFVLVCSYTSTGWAFLSYCFEICRNVYSYSQWQSLYLPSVQLLTRLSFKLLDMYIFSSNVIPSTSIRTLNHSSSHTQATCKINKRRSYTTEAAGKLHKYGDA